MKKLTNKDIEKVLSEVVNPDTGIDLISSKAIKGLQVSKQNDVVFLIEVDPKKGTELESLRQEAENVVSKIKNVGEVSVVLTAEKQEPKQQSNIPDPHGMNKNPALELPFKRIIAVASGKGGVGKSTIAANLAVSLSKKGEKVGLLDADVYGPSIPKLMGIENEKAELGKNKKLSPVIAHNVGVMSIGLLVDPDKPMIWRGPMAQSALYQMLRDVNWDGYDTLIVDMPPGTGDIQLTLAQKTQVTGAIIVSTSQDLALMDARKAIEMFNKTDVPVLGLIDNMSVHICSKCGNEDHIFGQDSVGMEAKKRDIPLLASIPLSHNMRDGLNDACQVNLSKAI